MTTRIPPSDVEAEKSLLGSALINNKYHQFLPSDAFYRTGHGIINEAIGALIQKGDAADVSTVSSWLRDKGDLGKAGGASLIASLTDYAITPKNAGEYAKVVREHAARRALICEATEAINAAYACDPLDELSAKLHGTANSIQPKAKKLRHVRDVAREVVDELEMLSQADELPGLSTGFCDIDKFVRLYPGEVTVIAGRPGMGKSAIALDMTRSALFNGQNVLWASLEMSSKRLVKRLLSTLSGIPGDRFNSAKFKGAGEWGRLSAALGRLVETNLWIDEQGAQSSQHIRSAANRISSEHGDIGLLVVDYLQLAREPGNWGKDKRLEVGQTSNRLLAASKELSCPVVLLSQLNRSVETRNPPIPIMSDLKESGEIEQDATNILLLYREEYYKKKETSPNKVGVADIVIGKSRNGPTGIVEVVWDGPTTSFKTMERYR